MEWHTVKKLFALQNRVNLVENFPLSDGWSPKGK